MSILYYNNKKVAMIKTVKEDTSDIKKFLVDNMDMPEDTPINEYINYLEKSLWEYTVNSSGVVTISKYIGESQEVTVPTPSVFNGTSIEFNGTSSADPIFSGDYVSITLPEGTTKILNYLMSNSSNCPNLYLPKSISTISGGNNFNTNLSNVYYAGEFKDWNNITFTSGSSNPMNVSESLYLNNIELTGSEFVIPDDVTDLNRYTLQNITLNKLTISPKVKSIGYGCMIDSSINTINFIGNGVDQWLYMATNLSQAISDNTNILINDSEIAGSIQVYSDIIPERAFNNCSNISNINFNINIHSIGSYAFYGCTDLSSLTLNGNIQYVGESILSGTTTDVYFVDMTEESSGWEWNWDRGMGGSVTFKTIEYIDFSYVGEVYHNIDLVNDVYFRLQMPGDGSNTSLQITNIEGYINLSIAIREEGSNIWQSAGDLSYNYDNTPIIFSLSEYSNVNTLYIKLTNNETNSEIPARATITHIIGSGAGMPPWVSNGTYGGVINSNIYYQTLNLSTSDNWFYCDSSFNGVLDGGLYGPYLMSEYYDAAGNSIGVPAPLDVYPSFYLEAGQYLLITNNAPEPATMQIVTGA